MAKQHEPKRIIYYRDAANEDYAGTDIDTKSVGADFPFAPIGAIWKFFAFIAYYVIAAPLVFFYCYLICGFRVKNRKAIRKIRKTGFFLYANHSHFTDAFLAPIVAFPKRAYVIVGPDTVSIKGLRNFVQMVGAIPIPERPRIIILNKVDMPEAKELAEFVKPEFEKLDLPVYIVSTASHEGLKELNFALANLVTQMRADIAAREETVEGSSRSSAKRTATATTGSQ